LLPATGFRKVYVGALHLFVFISTLLYKDFGALHLRTYPGNKISTKIWLCRFSIRHAVALQQVQRTFIFVAIYDRKN
jgi:hypothetical protein